MQSANLAGQLVGQPVGCADTPAALLDLDAFERNAATMASYLAERGLAWRPHVKAHKSARLARLQQEHGAAGVTCAKIGEAEVMVAGGISSVLVANELATPGKWSRAAALQRGAEVIVCADSTGHVRMAAAAAADAGVQIPLLIEVDIGMKRAGVQSGADALAVAAAIAAEPFLRLAGVMGYEGHLLTVWPEPDKLARCEAALSMLTRIADDIRHAGHEVGIVSCGGTGSFQTTAGLPALTEIQAGGGCLMDRFYADACHVAGLEQALSLVASVVSSRPDGSAIIDAGFKALGNLEDMPLPAVTDPPGVTVRGLSAEHGTLSSQGEQLRIGTHMRLIPGYSDGMLVLHDYMLGHRDGTITEVIEMQARGKLT